MDFQDLVHFLYECIYFLIVFGVFTLLVIVKGRQALVNVIVGLYFALLLSMTFPYYELLFSWTDSAMTTAILKLAIFVVFAALAVWLFHRIMPREFLERKFESFGKKLLLTLSATVLVMIFSFNVLPVTEFLDPGTPLQTLFGAEEYFFWWLVAPLVVLFLV